MHKNYDFLKILVIKQFLTEEESETLLENFNGDSFAVLEHLLEEGKIDKKTLGRCWGDSLGVAFVDLKKTMIQKNVVVHLTEEFARKNKVIAIYQMGNVVTVATIDPQNTFLIAKVEKMLKTQISSVFSFSGDIDDALDEHYSESIKLSKPKVQPSQPVKYQQSGAIAKETSEFLIENTKEIINDAYNEKVPKIEVSKEISKVIVEQVATKIDLGFCITQLRINDEYTYSHSVNVAILSAIMGKIVGLSTSVNKELTLGALLHDIGNVRIPKSVLYKNGHHTPQEVELIKRHPILGYQITKTMGLPDKIGEIVYNHHEIMTGKGYPRGVGRDEISLNTQIVSIVNLYDNLVSDKPNKKKVSHSEALNLMMLEGQAIFNFDLLYKFVNMAYRQDMKTLKKIFKSSIYGEIV